LTGLLAIASVVCQLSPGVGLSIRGHRLNC
jgi:hypothetical protein